MNEGRKCACLLGKETEMRMSFTLPELAAMKEEIRADQWAQMKLNALAEAEGGK